MIHGSEEYQRTALVALCLSIKKKSQAAETLLAYMRQRFATSMDLTAQREKEVRKCLKAGNFTRINYYLDHIDVLKTLLWSNIRGSIMNIRGQESDVHKI